MHTLKGTSTMVGVSMIAFSKLNVSNVALPWYRPMPNIDVDRDVISQVITHTYTHKPAIYKREGVHNSAVPLCPEPPNGSVQDVPCTVASLMPIDPASTELLNYTTQNVTAT